MKLFKKLSKYPSVIGWVLLTLLAIFTLGYAAPMGWGQTPSGVTSPLYSWTQYNDTGGLSARAIIKAKGTCPSLSFDGGAAAPMTLRSKGSDADTVLKDFKDIAVCQMTVPSGTKSILLNGTTTLPARVSDPQTMIVLGDTGCRVASFDVQNCKEADEWTYPDIAAKSAKVASDVILHVGDYHYREKCIFRMGCKWQNVDPDTVGYTWAAWEADFFKPSVPLFAKAPFIFTRGNHEDCRRAFRGWYYLIAPSDTYDQCARNTAPYAVEFDSFQVMVMDTSDSRRLDQTHFTGEFQTIFKNAKAAGKPSWLMTHVPIMGLNGGGRVSDWTLINAAGSAGGFPQEITANFAGHVHLFEKLSFTNGSPPQMVFGAGGTDLDGALSYGGTPTRTAQRSLSQINVDWAGDKNAFITSDSFDYGVITSSGSDWHVDVKLLDGRSAAAFSIVKDRTKTAP